ncbi:MAG TPA: hypothetical protein VG345_08105, partial [Bryobacteraceae bacterium]|nr:hypothetical protein [Bryobacteraceae bacterium]
IGQTWFPYFTSVLKQHSGSYTAPMYLVFGVAVMSGIAIALLPAPEPARVGPASSPVAIPDRVS